MECQSTRLLGFIYWTFPRMRNMDVIRFGVTLPTNQGYDFTVRHVTESGIWGAHGISPTPRDAPATTERSGHAAWGIPSGIFREPGTLSACAPSPDSRANSAWRAIPVSGVSAPRTSHT